MKPKDDQLFSRVSAWQGLEPWGRVLDAGTGNHSLSWILRLKTEQWTAVTGDPSRSAEMRQTFGGQLRGGDRLVVGNWSDPSFLQGERYDVVIADYLVGAIEGFAPYYQDQILGRLKPLVGRALYVVGLEPFDDHAQDEGGRLILEIARLRDACILLAGHRCYREFPLQWMLRHLDAAGFEVERHEAVPILYGSSFIQSQLGVARRKLPLMADRALARAMELHIDALERRALEFINRCGRIRFGSDYVIKATPR